MPGTTYFAGNASSHILSPLWSNPLRQIVTDPVLRGYNRRLSLDNVQERCHFFGRATFLVDDIRYRYDGVCIASCDHRWRSWCVLISVVNQAHHLRVSRIGGIGTATGKMLHAQGAKIALLYAPFEAERVKPTISEAYGSDSGANAYECDITSPTSVEAAFAAIAKDDMAFPSILVNTAGHVNLTPLEETPPEDSLKHYMINLYGPTLTSQSFARMYIAAAKQRKQQGSTPAPGGRIVSLASQAGHVALHLHGAYCASKAGLLGLTKSMASEWGPYGITANTVSPGPVWTALGKKAWSDQKVREEYQAAVSFHPCLVWFKNALADC